jgi:competence protein ComEA
VALDPNARDRLAALHAVTADAPAESAVPAGPGEPVEPVEPVATARPTRPQAVRRPRPVPEPDPPGVPLRAVLDRLATVTRLRDLRLEVGIGVLAVAVVALVAGVLWYRTGAGGPPPPAPAAGRSARPAPEAVPATAAGPGASGARTVPAGRAAPGVVVHVAGAVAQPGVLRMPEGARVIDAVEGAGGAVATADLDRLNLAARLTDGQRILVLEVGAAPVAGVPGTGSAPDPGALLDLNAATQAQLEGLPGIGPALAGAILAERDRRGGFRSVNELREVRGIGEARFADLRARVTV